MHDDEQPAYQDGYEDLSGCEEPNQCICTNVVLDLGGWRAGLLCGMTFAFAFVGAVASVVALLR